MALPIVFLSSSTAINAAEKVNVNQILEYGKLDIVNPTDTTKTQYQIIFTVASQGGSPSRVTFRYLLAATRDTAFTNISTAISTAI